MWAWGVAGGREVSRTVALGWSPTLVRGWLGFGGESCFCDSWAESQGLGPFLIRFLNSKGKRLLLLLGKAAEEGKCTARKQSYFFLDSKQPPSKTPETTLCQRRWEASKAERHESYWFCSSFI